MDPGSGFQLYVLDLGWTDLGHRYTTQDIWPVLASADLDKRVFLFGEDDILSYDWEHQEIQLSDSAIQRITRSAADKFLRDAVGRAFVVTLNDERLYGGLFYDPGGAAALRFPVIHALGDPISVLQVRPALGHDWTPNKPYLAAQCRAIANPRLHDRFAQLGLLGARQAPSKAVFFYGLFMDAPLLRERGVMAKEPRVARLDNFRLTIGARANVVPAQGRAVYGVLMRLPPDDLQRLYSEPGVSGYAAQTVNVTAAGGERIEASCYMLAETYKDVRVDPAYVQQLHGLAARLGFPPDYLAQIKQANMEGGGS